MSEMEIAARHGSTMAVALLVDGENISADHADTIWKMAFTYGDLRIRRVYGNLPTCCGWAEIPGFRLFHPGVGKNSADLLLTVDAVELACVGACDTFVIASSDGDFVHLADRLRERGHSVIGVGRETAAERFRQACTKFRILPQAAPSNRPDVGTDKTNPQAPVDLDLLVRREIAKHGNNGSGVRICDLSNVMFKEHSIRISELPERNWRSYLSKRPALFSLDPRGPN